jgi:hypothetical protein
MDERCIPALLNAKLEYDKISPAILEALRMIVRIGGGFPP